jgi:hypothetical protein
MTIAWLVLWVLDGTPTFPLATSSAWAIGFGACVVIDLFQLARRALHVD